jgi:hypothetical protein
MKVNKAVEHNAARYYSATMYSVMKNISVDNDTSGTALVNAGYSV